MRPQIGGMGTHSTHPDAILGYIKSFDPTAEVCTANGCGRTVVDGARAVLLLGLLYL